MNIYRKLPVGLVIHSGHVQMLTSFLPFFAFLGDRHLHAYFATCFILHSLAVASASLCLCVIYGSLVAISLSRLAGDQ